ncbi:quinone oxidoreductase [Brucella melitensis]|nr:quinone oxidoreductase [Brucella melitensis]
MPFTPAMKGAGIVVAVGAGREKRAVGERVAYAATPRFLCG